MRTQIVNHLSSIQLTSIPFIGSRFAVEDVEGLAAEPRTLGSEFAKLKDAVPTRQELPVEAQRRAVEFLRWSADKIEQIEIPVKSAAESTEAAEPVAAEVVTEQAGDIAAQPAA